MKATERNSLSIIKADRYVPSSYYYANNNYSKYKTNIFEAKKQKEIRDDIKNGRQKQLDKYYPENQIKILSDISILNIPAIGSPKSVQSIFLTGGELFMEQNPDLSNMEVQSRPRDATVKATVKTWRKGTVDELWNVDDETDLNGIEMDDQRLQIDLEIEYEGDTFEETIDYPFYESPSPKSKLGQFLDRYELKEGLELSVNYDSDQDFKNVVGITTQG